MTILCKIVICKNQSLFDFPLKNKDIINPIKRETVHPIDAAENAPPNTPKIPISEIAFLTPLATFAPKPTRGKEAPHPETLNKGSKSPIPPSKTPKTT